MSRSVDCFSRGSPVAIRHEDRGTENVTCKVLKKKLAGHFIIRGANSNDLRMRIFEFFSRSRSRPFERASHLVQNQPCSDAKTSKTKQQAPVQLDLPLFWIQQTGQVAGSRREELLKY